ncbi:MAG: hypothetical protein QF926_03120 [Alphaproteobacteria bacterium]|jgi:hypothetical protein|nr:hypothetical protein [Alphaproteobacteria bacterium]MDP6515603.1 hypothetical protein [Alphaproteobacteria bacterium]
MKAVHVILAAALIAAGGEGISADEDTAPTLFGLTFGQSAAKVMAALIEPVDFFRDSTGCLAQITTLHSRQTLSHAATWPISPDVDPLLRSVIYAIRANLDVVAGVSGGTYRIELAGGARRACLGFHDDRLYLIALRGDQIADIRATLERRIDRRFREIPFVCDGPKCGRKWLSPARDVLVELKAYRADGYGSAAKWSARQEWLAFTYIPVKAEQAAAIVATYAKLIEDTPAKNYRRERDWLEAIRDSVTKR